MINVKGFVNDFVNKASIKRALIATVIFGILFYVINYSPIGVSGLLKITNGANILDFEEGYSLEKAYGMLEQLGETGREFYLKIIMPQDIFFPIGFMLFNSHWIALLLKKLTKEGSPFRWLTCLAVLNMLCDWGENIGISVMLVNFPIRLETVCRISSGITKVKFLCVESILLCFAIGIIGVIAKIMITKVRKAI